MLEVDRLAAILEARKRGVDYVTGRPIRDAGDVVVAADDDRREKLGDIVALSRRSASTEQGLGIRGRRVGNMDAPKSTRGR